MRDQAAGVQTAKRLRVGFLHVGREHSGLRRYGTILAAEARRRPDLWVSEADAGGRDAGFRDLRQAARSLGDVDVVHLQWKLADWGVRSGGLPRLEVLQRSLRQPLLVTMHDVFPPSGRVTRRLSPAALGLRRLGGMAARLVVHSDDERGRLAGFVPASRLEVVPHFVEVRASLPERATARDRLGLVDRRVVTLLGAITKRRGHRLVLDALLDLPVDVTALFVGSVIEGRDHVARDLQAHAAALGVTDRVRFLGYLSDHELERVLVATDVAVCPFRFMSASGALATWISSGRPIVASDLPPIRELDALAPGALRRFAPYEAPALAAAIREALASAGDTPDERVQRLASELATPRIVERYAALYRAAARSAPDPDAAAPASGEPG